MMMSSSSPATIDVFVAGLPGHVDKNMLQEFASNYNCVGAKILFRSNNAVNTSSSKNGFVSFTSVESAKYFISAFNGTDPFNCGVKFVARFADGKNGEQRKIHFGGLIAEVTEADVSALCSPYGQILNTNRLFDKACCFVTFSTGAEASACVAGLLSLGYSVSLAKGGKRGSNTSSIGSPAKRSRSSASSPASMMSPASVMSPMDNFQPINQTVDEFGNVYTTFQQMPVMPMMMPMPMPVMSPIMF